MAHFGDDLFMGQAQTYMGLGNYPISATFTGSVSSTVLTVTAMLSGDEIVVGQYITGTSVTAGSYITGFLTGTGGVGTYSVSASSSASSTTIYAGGNALLGDPAPMDRGVGPLGRIYVWDCIPLNKVANNISAAATYTGAGTATLAAGTGSKAVVRTDGVAVIQLDVPRVISVTIGTGTIADTAITVSGYDYYGQPMSEVIQTGTTPSTAVLGKKAFFQVSSVAVAGAVGGTVAIGTGNTLGIPVRVTDKGYVARTGWDSTLADDAGVLVVADTATATTTSGDVRGTYAPSSDPDGKKRLVLGILLPAIAVGPNATRTGALGVTQA